MDASIAGSWLSSLVDPRKASHTRLLDRIDHLDHLYPDLYLRPLILCGVLCADRLTKKQEGLGEISEIADIYTYFCAETA